MTKPRIRLVTRGDDAGSCASANRAIAQACREGILRNASVMVPGPAFDAVPALLANLPGVAIGLHVVLNAEWDGPKWGPVLPPQQVPSLVDGNGHFLPTPNDLETRGADVEEMVAEVAAQLAKARADGLKLSYLDEHMGVGWVAGLRERLTDLARREGLVLAHRVRHLPMVPPSESVSDRLIHSLAAAAPGDYVYVAHPGLDAADMREFCRAGLSPGQVARERDAERRALVDPRVRQWCETNGVAVVRYTDVISVEG